MKNLIYLFLLITSITFAQKTTSKNLGDFNKLKFYSGLQVQLIKSNVAKIEIKGSNNEDIVIKNKNGILKLAIKLPKALDHDNTLIKLYYTKDLDLIDANQGSVVTSNDKLKQDYIEIRAQEGAKIELKIKVQNLKVKSVTGGNVVLVGKAINQIVITNTGGVYQGFDLQTQNATVTATTGGEAEVNAIEFLDARVKLKGFIIYKVKPKNLKKKKILGGKVCSLDNYHNNGGTRVNK